MRFVICFFGLLFLVNISSSAQNEAKNWFFGYHYGVTFSPSPQTLIGGQTEFQYESVISYSDRNTGKLLFYGAPQCDGDPNKALYQIQLWNSSHTPMKGGTNIRGNATCNQAMLVVPFPNDNTKYYIFTNDPGATDCPVGNTVEDRGLWYSVIDMQGDNGKGEVITRNKLVWSSLPDIGESVTGTLHCNGRDYWLIVFSNEKTEAYAIPITSKGIETSRAVVSSLPPGAWKKQEQPLQSSEVSPDGRRIALWNSKSDPTETTSDLWLFDFDSQTGAITNGQQIGKPGENRHFVGLSFSPDNTKLYATRDFGAEIVQYDLSQPSYPMYIIPNATVRCYSLQCGPDKKIYVFSIANAPGNPACLHTITNPNGAGSACGFTQETVILGEYRTFMTTTLSGLPNYMDHIFSDSRISCYSPDVFLEDDTTCIGSTIRFHDSSSLKVLTRNWTFEGGIPANSTDSQPMITYTKTGTFQVQLIACTDNGCDTLLSTAVILPLPPVSCLGDTSLCKGASAPLRATGAVTYLWTPPIGLSDPTSATPTATPSITTSYTVQGTDAHGCVGYDSVLIIVRELPVQISSDTTICEGESVGLWATGGEQYEWTPADSLDDPRSATPVARPSQTTTYHVSVTNSSGCSGVGSVTVQVSAGTLRRVAIIAPTQKVKPGSITDVHLSVEAGISAIAGQLLYDGTGLKLTGVPTISNGWNLTATETGYGITDITAQGAATGTDITLPMTVYLPPDARESEPLVFTPRYITTLSCDSTKVLPTQLYYDPTCAWKLRTVVGNGKAYSVMVQGESVVYSVGLASSIRVVLYDNLGQRIATLSDGYHASGEYRVRLPEVAVGMYAARLETPLGAWSALLTKE